jgi:hypothetical protein
MEALITCLPAILRAAGDSPEVVEAAAIAAWKHAAGAGLRQHAVPLRLDEETLFVSVPDSLWQKQLSSMLDELLFRVNRLLGHRVVSRIDLRIDPTTCSRIAGSEQAPQQSNDVPLEIWSAAAAIADKELRQAFLKSALAQIRRLETHNK